MTTGELLLELGTEEIPAGEVEVALDALCALIVSGLSDHRLTHGQPRTFATPRRLAVVVPDVQTRQADLNKEVSGPPVKFAFKDGQPTKAAVGFAKGLGLTVEDLEQRETPKGAYLVAKVSEHGRAAHEFLPALLAECIAKIPFKRTMRWGSGEAAFIRPLQWILAVFDGETIPVTYADVTAGRVSYGHRFLAPDAFDVSNASDYLEALSARHVVADISERRALIVSGAERLAQSVGARLRPDEELIDEILFLVEKPVPMLCAFDDKYLEIPNQVLISEMREHQRYLALTDAEGELLPYFVVIANTDVEDEDIVKDGYRRVLTARFEDGAFFYREDQKKPLFDAVEKLGAVQFHRALGSVREKVGRSVANAFSVGMNVGVLDDAPADTYALAQGAKAGTTLTEQLARAGWLMKNDLVSRMVYEFPDLQGTMGQSYARLGGESEPVCDAIASHYRPRFSGDTPPEDTIGALLALGDRIDTIIGIFSVGKGPTGTADPFGLRRAAIGVLQTLRTKNWHLSLPEIIEAGVKEVGAAAKKPADQVQQEVADFFRARLRGVLTGEGVPVDVAEAALSVGFDDVVDAADRAKALLALRSTPDFEPLAVTFKRVANILKGQAAPALDGASLTEAAERTLFEAQQDCRGRWEAQMAARDFDAALRTLAALRPTVDAFFNDVMVMDPDAAVRDRRLALLGALQSLFAPLADFTKLS